MVSGWASKVRSVTQWHYALSFQFDDNIINTDIHSFSAEEDWPSQQGRYVKLGPSGHPHPSPRCLTLAIATTC